MPPQSHRKHPVQMLLRVVRCLFRETGTADLVCKSYDRICAGYDAAWTNHMRDLTSRFIDSLPLKTGDHVIDLTCGTGFATSLIAKKTAGRTVGVDRSAGMLGLSRKNYGDAAQFIQSDILPYLKTVPDNSVDAVTCCWGLGYSRPGPVLREIRRVLKPGGVVGVIDNSLFSLFEVLYCSFLTFLENPASLQHVMRFRFLTGSRNLRLWYRLAGLRPAHCRSGQKTYAVSTGSEAIDRLRATGAAAGFEYAASPDDEERIFRRFAEILEAKYLRDGKIEIHHRYFEGFAIK